MEEKGKTVAQNKKAYHDYFIEDTFEAGVELLGTEVKSIRRAAVNLKDSYCYVIKGELFVMGMHISPYEKGNIFNKDPLRVRKLLLHKQEIGKLIGASAEQGYSIIPLSVYFKRGRVKLQIALARGKKLYDKRDDAARRDAARDIDRALKDRSRS